HSMGSIIAYDVLTDVASDVNIHTFMTLGSPLGSPAVMKKMLAEQYAEQTNDSESEKKLATPENIKKNWLNLSDLNDNVALNYDLADDFEPNSHGVGPKDVIVNNDYEYEGKKNPHKSYGYLRTPEVAEVIHEFLAEERPSLADILRDSWERFIALFSR
nr:hypothetical protein [candidate division KSB1 bacterium]NIR73245.1 hypothetical protein [candidate division KSB1 bacterium]NIS28359.1 hypothetical protein [candidate division KSB1 bacterium]NIT75003.1 hypothetical protein [candidate division KSB1 bacterium]NIU29092.1 hypothetical protein [candidate division KSB1 bacterium]